MALTETIIDQCELTLRNYKLLYMIFHGYLWTKRIRSTYKEKKTKGKGNVNLGRINA